MFVHVFAYATSIELGHGLSNDGRPFISTGKKLTYGQLAVYYWLFLGAHKAEELTLDRCYFAFFARAGPSIPGRRVLPADRPLDLHLVTFLFRPYPSASQ